VDRENSIRLTRQGARVERKNSSRLTIQGARVARKTGLGLLYNVTRC
jgi:hypothetical protein